MDFYNIKESMKRLFSVLIACVSGLLITAGCEVLGFDKEVDWALVHFVIEATDAEGNSIISPDMPGMSLTFQGESYTVEEAQVPAEIPRRYKFLALPARTAEGSPSDEYYLWFGEIDGAEDMDEDIVLNWPDGSMDIIHYHCSNHHKWPQAGCTQIITLNGVEQEFSRFKFTGKNLSKQ